MPIFTSPTPPPSNAPVVQETVQYGNVEHPLNSVRNIEGSPVVVTYYQQILREHDIPKQIDLLLDPTQQEYRKINHAELMFQGELNYSSDPATGTVTVTGDIQLYPSMVPNNGDHFLMRMADGTQGIFVIRETERLTYLNKPAFSASIALFQVATQVYLDNLELKTTQINYFSSRTKELGTHPYENGTRSIDIAKLIRLYYDEFIDDNTQTFLLPEQEFKERVYDPLLVEFCNKVFPRHLRGVNPRVQMYNCEVGQPFKNLESVWDLIMTRTDYARDRVVKQYRKVSAFEFSTVTIHYNVATSTIDKVVWPLNYDLPYTEVMNDLTGQPYYVLSQAFYERDEANYTQLDQFVSNYISGQDIQYADLIEPVNALLAASPLERFYQIPLYFVLAMNAVN